MTEETAVPERVMSREQVYMLPPSLDEWTPPEHPARFVAMVLESMSAADWRAMTIDPVPAREGAPRYAPRMLTAVWVYGFMTGVRSARGLERACRDQIPLRWLTMNQCPDHNTLWRFYKEHRTGMRALLTRSIRVAVKTDLVDLALMAVDGTKLRANAAVERSLDATGLTKLLERTEKAIAALEARNEAGDEPPPPSLPERLRTTQALREQVRQALEDLETEEVAGKLNLTDGEAKLMKGRQGIAPAYNGQAAVVPTNATAGAILGAAAPAGRFIVAATVTTLPNDAKELTPVITEAVSHLGETPALTVADAGYHSGEALAEAEAAGYPVVMPESSTTGDPYHRAAFVHDAEQDTLTCPKGAILTFRRLSTETGKPPRRLYQGDAAVCRACPAFGVCTKDRVHGRVVKLSPHDALLQQHRAFRELPDQRAAIKRRRELVEPVFGVIKEVLQCRRLLLRGKTNVEAEWSLLATAFNLRTLHRVWRALDPAARARMVASGQPG
jgi:transposase